MIIAAVGLPGAGKTEVSEFFLKKGFKRVYFGDVTFDRMKEKGLEITEANERATREQIRKELGMPAYAILSYPKIQKLVEQGQNVIVESMYSWEEYLYLKKELGDNLKVIAIYSSQKTRAKRLANRPERPLSLDELVSRDHSQIENLHQAGPIALAEYTIINEFAKDHLLRELERIYSELSSAQ